MAATPASVSKTVTPTKKVTTGNLTQSGTRPPRKGPQKGPGPWQSGPKQTKPLPMPTIPGNRLTPVKPMAPRTGNLQQTSPGSGQTWSNPFIPAPRVGPPPRNGGFPGTKGPRSPRNPGPIDPRQLPGPRKGSGMMGSLQEIARRRLQGGF
jgi:hypothetical protein